MERGNTLLRAVDKYFGMLLLPFAMLFRKVFRPKPCEIRTVGIICLAAIGDLLLCSGLVNALKARGLRVELITTKANSQVAGLLGADAYFSFKLKDMLGMLRHLHARKYDLLLDTTQWARIGALLSAFSRAGQTVGFRSAGEYRSLPYDIKVQHRLDMHESQNFLNLGRAVWAELDGAVRLPVSERTEQRGSYVVCHMWGTGTYALEKRWTEEKWAELALHLADNGTNVFFSGSAADKTPTEDFINRYFSGDERIKSSAGRYSLTELKDFLLASKLVISVNTGIMHYAALLGVPTIGLTGPSNPVQWAVIGERALTLCPSDADIPPLMAEAAKDRRNWTCQIEVQAVLEALKENILWI